MSDPKFYVKPDQSALIQVYNEDCFQRMPRIAEHSVQMVWADIPYNLTNCKWDQVEWDLEAMWKEFKRVLKPNGVVVMTATEPFNVDLINSNRKMFRYSWIWVKNLKSGFLNAKKMPLKGHELVLVFYKHLPTYNPQMEAGARKRTVSSSRVSTSCYGKQVMGIPYDSDVRYPSSVQTINCVLNSQRKGQGLLRHPTEKPVQLVEYMIKTYTNEGDLVLDPCMGTGSSMVACERTSRSGIGIELNTEYYDTAVKRLK